MRILLLSPLCPLPLEKGGAVRLWNIAKEISKKHPIDLLCFIRFDEERRYENELKTVFGNVFFVLRRPLMHRSVLQSGFHQFPRFLFANFSLLLQTLFSRRPFLSHLYFSDAFRDFVCDVDRRQEYDLFYAETFYVLSSLYDLIDVLRTPVLLIEQNIESLAYKRHADTQRNVFLRSIMHLDVYKIAREEQYFWRHVSFIGGVSSADTAVIRRFACREPLLLENGVDTSWFRQQIAHRVCDEVLFVGSFTYFQNVDSLMWLIREVWPRVVAYSDLSHVRLRIVGRGADSSLQKFIYDAGFTIDSSVDDIREAMQRATVLLAPIRSGSGTKYKILEALASRLPVVTTRLGAEGLALRDGIEAFISDSPFELAEKVHLLFTQPALRTRISDNGFAYVQSHYDWHTLVSSFLHTLEGRL